MTTPRFANPNQALSLLPEILRNGRPSPTGNWAALKDWAEGNEYRELMESKLAGLRYQNTAARLPKMLARKLFMKGGRFYGSVTKLQNYRSCPYQYFLRYGIGVEERDTGEADYLDYGNYLHAGLHQFGEVLKSQNRQWRQATDEEIEKISEDITENHAAYQGGCPFLGSVGKVYPPRSGSDLPAGTSKIPSMEPAERFRHAGYGKRILSPYFRKSH